MAKNLGLREELNEDLTRKELLKCYWFLMLSSYEAYGITVAEAPPELRVLRQKAHLRSLWDGENCIGIENPVTRKSGKSTERV